MKRCPWCNLANPLYVKYHDEEWGRLNLDEHYLFEMLILESFQAGLSWECVLNKRENFRQAYDNFELHKICNYDETKIQSLLENKGLIRNKLKIRASINNAQIFQEIQKEHGSFAAYLKKFTNSELTVELPGGNLKIIYFENENRVKLIGDSYFVFDGKMIYK